MNVITVTQLNNLVKSSLDNTPELSSVYVQGEISNCKLYPSGHWYFSLKDSESSVRCVMFRRDASMLRFRPENGMRIIAVGRVTVYPRDGQYQLYCASMQPDGIGALHVAFEQLVSKLKEQGLFDTAHKKPIPRFPERIALITSGAGAAVHDMIRILGKRYPLAKVIVMPVRVQGDQAADEIRGAIRYANRYKVADLIIAGRGGGSIEDLWAFNDEALAHEIYNSAIPVISAVGHEPDFTIADFVADLRASTPSNGAELAVPDRYELSAMLRESSVMINRSMANIIAQHRKKLAALSSARVITSPLNYVQDKRIALAYLSERFYSAGDRLISRGRQKFASLASSLDALSPLKVLSRGYSLVRGNDGSIIKSSDGLHIGDALTVSFSRGEADCVVTGIKP
jgi:exodeoxyribonuclease VII large subunit